MLGNDSHRKVTASHLRREAFLYVRQSTLKQVIENVESTQRQYALRDRAVALGWGHDRIRTIDRDLGQSSAIAEVREGFKTLVSEVGLGHAGIVMGLEVSRLAHNSTEWHRLVCADPRFSREIVPGFHRDFDSDERDGFLVDATG